MTKSCWLQFSFLNEMVNTSFQAARLLISPRATTTSHSNLYRLPPLLLLRPWSDKADHEVNRVFPSHSIVTAFFFCFFCLSPCKMKRRMKRVQLHLDTQSLPWCLKLQGGAFGAAAGACNISGYWIERDMKRWLRLSALLTGSRSWEVVGGTSGWQHQWHGHCRCDWRATAGAGLTSCWRADALKVLDMSQHSKDTTSLTAGCISHSAV